MIPILHASIDIFSYNYNDTIVRLQSTRNMLQRTHYGNVVYIKPGGAAHVCDEPYFGMNRQLCTKA